MSLRFREPTTITVSPDTITPITVGQVALGDDDDTIWIKVTSSPQSDCPWPWSYGLLTWISENGRELGTVKINGVCEGEVFKLGVGLSPSFRTGSLSFTPRTYNLKWIELGHPWKITFSWETGISGGGQLPAFGSRATLMTPAVPEGNAKPDYSLLDGLAWLFFTFGNR